MKFTFISGITLSVVVRLGAPLGTSEAPEQDSDSPFGCTKREIEKCNNLWEGNDLLP
jgi:hypothetical protein